MVFEGQTSIQESNDKKHTFGVKDKKVLSLFFIQYFIYLDTD